MKYDLAKVWRRGFAMFLDLVMLAILGAVLGQLFGEYFIQLGSNGIWIGFLVSMTYFSILNSNVAGGQTIGKRIMKIMVIGEDDQGLPLVKAIARTAIFLIPGILVNNVIINTLDTAIVQVVKGLIGSGIVNCFYIVYALNESTRQALHDLPVKSYVVKNKEAFNLVDEPFAKPAVSTWVYYAYTGLVVLLLSLCLHSYTNNSQTNPKLGLISTTLEKQTGVYHASATVNNTFPFFLTHDAQYETLKVTLDVSKLPKDVDDVDEIKRNKIVKNSIRLVLNTYPQADSLSIISFHLNKGYNIGIARSSELAYISKTPEEWREIFDLQVVAKPAKR